MGASALRPGQQQQLALALERERQQLIERLHSLSEAGRALGEAQGEEGAASGNPADVASDLAAEEIAFTLEHADRARLADVTAALHRIDEGRYGLCISCGRPIMFERLQALPWTRYCRVCVSQPIPARPSPGRSAFGAIARPAQHR